MAGGGADVTLQRGRLLYPLLLLQPPQVLQEQETATRGKQCHNSLLFLCVHIPWISVGTMKWAVIKA